ncbi:MAG: hypothetical protein ACTSUO_04745 [Candidatus Thorarchaeota archaeon]
MTVTTVVVLVIGILSLCLALYGGYVSTSVVEGLEGDQTTQHEAEQKYYLLGMIGIIVLAARLLVVPIFFWMLQSLVPYCPGAMCASGVVNVSEPYSTISLVLKIFLPAVYGLWLVIELSNRGHPELPFTRLLSRTFLILLLPLVLIDSAVDVLLVTTIDPVYAPCCSSVYDVDPPFSPSALFGPEFGILILALTVMISISVILIQWLEIKKPKLAYLSVALLGVIAFLYLITVHDTLAPIALGLSNHHCPYCLFQEFPDTALFAGLFWIGVASGVWRILLEMLWKHKELPLGDIQGFSTFLRKLSSIAILFSMVSLVSHILIAI